jgi:energy-coupling factor transport system permease protein
LLVPLFASSFKRADELATAMECRCYRGDKNRTKLVKLTFRASDIAAFIFGTLFLAIMIALLIIVPMLAQIIPTAVYNIIFYLIG